MNMQISALEDQVATQLSETKLEILTVMSSVNKDWKLHYTLHYYTLTTKNTRCITTTKTVNMASAYYRTLIG